MKKIVPGAKRARDSAPPVRPFFGYYGGKWRDALKIYPPPEFGTVIEPFAGSAGYALRYHSKKVILCEIDPIVASVWSYLIRVTSREILELPDMPLDGEATVDDLPATVCQEAKWLIGFWLNRGVSTPRKSPSLWMRAEIRPGSFWGVRVRQTIASQLHLIRHWKIYNREWWKCPMPRKTSRNPDRAGTWFVDPPYFGSVGAHYKFGSEQINYAVLAQWCRTRPGQVIVCENKGATWLPFDDRTFSAKTTRAKRSDEIFWSNDPAPIRPPVPAEPEPVQLALAS